MAEEGHEGGGPRTAAIVCSSRELFGADRSALHLAKVLGTLGVRAHLEVPANRPERGLTAAAARRDTPLVATPVTIASSRGLEGWSALVRRAPARSDFEILNSTAVIHAGHRRPRLRVLIVREWLERERRPHRALAALHGRRADLVVAISNGVRRQWEAIAADAKPAVVIPGWLDAHPYASSSHFAPLASREGILCIGRFNAWKGQPVLASEYEAAFAGAAERPRLTFVGEQPGTPFEGRAQAVKQRGESGLWDVRPFVDDPSAYYDAAALVVIPSLHPEPFGLVILEALASGCRVIVYEGGGPDDLAALYPHCVRTVPRSPGRLGDALKEWWAGGGQAQSESEYATTLRLIEAHHSPRAAVSAWRAALSL